MAILSAASALNACFFELAEPIDPNDGGPTGPSETGLPGPADARTEAPADAAPPAPKPDGGDSGKDAAASEPCFGGGEPPAEPVGDVVSAELFATPPAIDGTVDDWTDHTRHALADWCPGCTQQHPIPPVVDPSPPSAADLSAQFRLGWDAAFLYVLVEVRDDDLVGGAVPVDAGALGAGVKQDAVELLLNSDRSSGGFGPDDRQLFYALDGSIEWPNQPASALPPLPSSHAVRSFEGCYVVEIRLAWQYVTANSQSTVEAEREIGLVVAVNDWDRLEGGSFERQSHLFSKSPGDGYWNSPGSFGPVFLAP